MATTSDFKNGFCIKHNNDIFQILEFQHVKPGKGGAFVRTKLKNISNNKIINFTFNAGAKIKPIRIENRKYQFLYKENEKYHFMNTINYEQLYISQSMIAGYIFLKEGEAVELLFNTENEQVISCQLPKYVILKVKYTEPGIKGDTATNTLKDCVLETNAKTKVPLFIKIGDTIKINTKDGSYSERIKNC